MTPCIPAEVIADVHLPGAEHHRLARGGSRSADAPRPSRTVVISSCGVGGLGRRAPVGLGGLTASGRNRCLPPGGSRCGVAGLHATMAQQLRSKGGGGNGRVALARLAAMQCLSQGDAPPTSPRADPRRETVCGETGAHPGAKMVFVFGAASGGC